MKNIKANPYLGRDRAPFPVARVGSINPYLGRDPNPFPINRIGSINPNHQPIMTQGESTGQSTKAEATIVMAARARRRRRQNQRLQANGKQMANT